jgi:hypothetical protein
MMVASLSTRIVALYSTRWRRQPATVRSAPAAAPFDPKRFHHEI